MYNFNLMWVVVLVYFLSYKSNGMIQDVSSVEQYHSYNDHKTIINTAPSEDNYSLVYSCILDLFDIYIHQSKIFKNSLTMEDIEQNKALENILGHLPLKLKEYFIIINSLHYLKWNKYLLKNNVSGIEQYNRSQNLDYWKKDLSIYTHAFGLYLLSIITKLQEMSITNQNFSMVWFFENNTVYNGSIEKSMFPLLYAIAKNNEKAASMSK